MRTIVALVCLAVVASCGDDTSSDDAADASTEHDKDHEGEHDKPAAREVPCTDSSVSALMLFNKPATGKIREEGSGSDFVTFIDATGGALNPTQSYVYAKFTSKGLEKLELSDEDAFESTDWDIAFRRYVVRLNSGVSGPGDVKGGRTAPMTKFEDLSAVPESIEFRTEEYFAGDTCEFVSDGSGLEAPATALASFWSYKECVQMTNNVYVVALPKGKHVKLQVLSYYAPENQKTCDATGRVPMPSGAGAMRVKWAFL